MLKLKVGDEKGEVQNANVPVRWCVDKETLEKIQQDGVKNPHILLVTTDGRYEMTRQLAPLEQVIEYVQFQRPGINKIYATIVWEKSGKYNDLWETYLQKERGRYATSVINYDGNLCRLTGSVESTVENVNIPDELFAKELPRWIQKWVNLWFKTRPEDQCCFRRRMITAFTIQPPIVFLWLILRIGFGALAAFFLLLCAMTKINFKPIIHPWRDDVEDIWSDTKERYGGGSIFTRARTNKKGNSYSLWYLSPLTPLYFLLIALIVCLWQILEYGFVTLGLTIWGTVVAVGTSITILLIGAAIFKLIDYTFENCIRKQLLRFQKQTVSITDYENVLICNGDLSTDIRALPQKKRTIHLRFQDLKAKVCKPIPR